MEFAALSSLPRGNADFPVEIDGPHLTSTVPPNLIVRGHRLIDP